MNRSFAKVSILSATALTAPDAVRVEEKIPSEKLWVIREMPENQRTTTLQKSIVGPQCLSKIVFFFTQHFDCVIG